MGNAARGWASHTGSIPSALLLAPRGTFLSSKTRAQSERRGLRLAAKGRIVVIFAICDHPCKTCLQLQKCPTETPFHPGVGEGQSSDGDMRALNQLAAPHRRVDANHSPAIILEAQAVFLARKAGTTSLSAISPPSANEPGLFAVAGWGDAPRTRCWL